MKEPSSDQARLIAERVAQKVSSGGSLPQVEVEAREISAELAAVSNSLRELQNRLTQIESMVRSGGMTAEVGSAAPLRTHSPWLAGVNADFSHPSQERFGVEEATVSELVDFFQKEKSCSLDPSGKPCDHCAMCSSRGF
jgi:hypothetical protein